MIVPQWPSLFSSLTSLFSVLLPNSTAFPCTCSRIKATTTTIVPLEAHKRPLIPILPTTKAQPLLAPTRPPLPINKPLSLPTTLVIARPTRMARRLVTLLLARLPTAPTALPPPCPLPIPPRTPPTTIRVSTTVEMAPTTVVLAHTRLNKVTILLLNTMPLPTLNTLNNRNKTMATDKLHLLDPIQCKRERTHSTMETRVLLLLQLPPTMVNPLPPTRLPCHLRNTATTKRRRLALDPLPLPTTPRPTTLHPSPLLPLPT